MARFVRCHPIPDICADVETSTPEPPKDWMEMEVTMGFRVWQLMFLALAGLITVVVLLCCFMKCRVPRTKQEIEADFKRKEITRRFRFLLNKVHVEDTSLRTALDKVNDLYSDKEKKLKRTKKKKEEGSEEEIDSFDSSEMFADEKLTVLERIKKILKIQREGQSDSEDESTKKSDIDQSEAKTKGSDTDDDDTDISESKINDKKNDLQKQTSNDSQESSGSPKKEFGHSALSLLVDSPMKPHDSRLTLLQDSPQHFTPSLLEETPPNMRKPRLQKKLQRHSSSQDSNKSLTHSLRKQKTDSQESKDSQKSGPCKQKSDSQDSKGSDPCNSKDSTSTLMKEYLKKDSNQSSKDSKKNNASHTLRRSSPKDPTTSSSNSKETSFQDSISNGKG